ncbi:MAG: cyclopropane fatty acyl phospholipid synthase [Halieaceae bacterium]|jgi:cyclopropane-fatty-acyl-phospholipid synthase|nr:cyclopropane fatty acyl phospholipid synthase [Halieaceae bacterium]
MRSANIASSSRAQHQQDSRAPALLRSIADKAGVSFNGDAPWDIQVHDTATYRRILTHGSLGFGEAYMDGMWDSQRLDELFYRLLGCGTSETIRELTRWRFFSEAMRHRLRNLQSRSRSFQVGEHHYDIGNDVFEAMLDPTMSYSCGYWSEASDLAQAQRNKLDLVCRKLELQKGERLLDIGCGWGSLARFAAEEYGVEVTGVTVSREQLRRAQNDCHGLPVRIELLDYRELRGRYDKIASIGMFEHVGPKNYTVYLDTVTHLLEDHGLFLLHTIGSSRTSAYCDPWIDRYIFPNGHLPSANQLAAALEDRLLIEDWHNFGPDYDRTLMAWWDNFNAAWPTLKRRYDRRFYRMWKYYLLSCAGMFRARQAQLWQLVLGKGCREGTYRSVR